MADHKGGRYILHWVLEERARCLWLPYKESKCSTKIFDEQEETGPHCAEWRDFPEEPRPQKLLASHLVAVASLLSTGPWKQHKRFAFWTPGHSGKTGLGNISLQVAKSGRLKATASVGWQLSLTERENSWYPTEARQWVCVSWSCELWDGCSRGCRGL